MFGAFHDYLAAITPVQERLSQLSAEEAELVAERNSIATSATREICARSVGKVVTAAKIRDSVDGPTIGVYEFANGQKASQGVTYINAHGLTSPLYVEPDLLPRERKQVIGTGVGADLEHNALVLRSRFLPGVLYWVRLIDTSGEPLVTLTMREPRLPRKR